MDADRNLIHYEGYGSRPKSLRKHWVNCCLRPDEETTEIDRMEDALSPEKRQRAQPIRQSIARFESCHWNSDRWLERIIQGIAEERLPPTSGRPRIQHPLAQMLVCLRELLRHWVAQSTSAIPQCAILDRSSIEVHRSLGARTPFKTWVVQRVVEGLEHHMRSARLLDSPHTPLAQICPDGLMLDSSEADQYFPDSLDLLNEARSRKLKVKKEIDSQIGEYSLAFLCGSLTPCNKYYFIFLFALFEHLDDPDGERILPAPFCGNISQNRHQRYYQAINALRQHLGKPPEGSLPADGIVLDQLGGQTQVKRWLVASLEKTLREQTPPAP